MKSLLKSYGHKKRLGSTLKIEGIGRPASAQAHDSAPLFNLEKELRELAKYDRWLLPEQTVAGPACSSDPLLHQKAPSRQAKHSKR